MVWEDQWNLLPQQNEGCLVPVTTGSWQCPSLISREYLNFCQIEPWNLRTGKDVNQNPASMLTCKWKHKVQGSLPRGKEAIREAEYEPTLSHFPILQRSVAYPFTSSLADPQLSCSVVSMVHFPRHLAKLNWYQAKVSALMVSPDPSPLPILVSPLF